MKVNLDTCGLTMVTTLGCSSACGHCYLGCCPSKARFHISGDEMVSILRNARSAGIRSVAFSGGEPFIFIKDLFRAITGASDLGMQISIRTNGFWAADERVAEKIIAFLACHKVSQLGLSYDNFHGKFVDLGCIERIIKVSRGAGLSVWLDWIGAESAKQVWQIFGGDMPLVRYIGRPVRVGRARELDKSHFCNQSLESVEFESPFSFRCGHPDDVFLEVYPNRVVALGSCCYGNPRLLRERAMDNWWIERLVSETEKDPAIDFLYMQGVGGLIRKAKEETPDLVAPSYTSDCEACFALLGRLFPKKQVDTYMFGNNGRYGSIAVGLRRHIGRVVDRVIQDSSNKPEVQLMGVSL